MRPVFYKGVPVGNLQAANQLTLPGSLRDVARYKFAQDSRKGDAITAVNTGITRQYMDASQNPYHQVLATDVYNVQLQGLGSGDDIMAPGSAAPAAPSGWLAVVNTFVGNISKGLAAKIGGYPATPAITMPTSLSTVPPWAMVGLAAGGGLLLLSLLKRKA